LWTFLEVSIPLLHLYITESVAALFTMDMDGNRVQYDFVVNCAAETKLGQSDAVSIHFVPIISWVFVILYTCIVMGIRFKNTRLALLAERELTWWSDMLVSLWIALNHLLVQKLLLYIFELNCHSEAFNWRYACNRFDDNKYWIFLLFVFQVYADGIYKLSCNCAREAARFQVRRYVELSTAQMASSDKVSIVLLSPCTVFLLPVFVIL